MDETAEVFAAAGDFPDRGQRAVRRLSSLLLKFAAEDPVAGPGPRDCESATVRT